MTDRELEGRLRAWYRAEVGEDVIAPVSLRRDVAAIPRTESRPAGRFDRRRGVMLFAAAALVLVGGAAAVGSGLLRLPSLVPPEPVPSVAIVPTSSPAAESPSPLISPPTVRASSWTVTGPMIEAREGGTATLLLDGKVLVAGGFGKQDGPGGVMSPLASAELYDPGSGSWTATGSMVTPRQGSTATLLPDGRVLVAGVVANGANLDTLASAELYDPGTGTWTATGRMITPRVYQKATLLPDGAVLVTGGLNGSEGGPTVAELYHPASGTWTATRKMVSPGQGDSATLLPDGKVLLAGGADGTSAELYDPRSGSWTATGSMVTHRRNQTATLLSDGRVLVPGGEYDTTGYSTSAELYDPATRTWTATGSMTTPRSNYTATLLPDGMVLVAGGNTTGAADSAELYDPGSP